MSPAVEVLANTGVRTPRLPPAEIDQCIAMLEIACERSPWSADLRTCLGMAYAMRRDMRQSMDTLEAAMRLDPAHFFARFKYAELHYRLRALDVAEAETLDAMELAAGARELALARRQLAEIRRRREVTSRPAVSLLLLVVALSLAMLGR